MKRWLDVFVLSKAQRRVVVIVILLLIAVALLKHRRDTDQPQTRSTPPAAESPDIP